MQYQIITKTVEEYLIAFPIKMEEVGKVTKTSISTTRKREI
jgi:hypothetical protein